MSSSSHACQGVHFSY